MTSRFLSVHRDGRWVRSFDDGHKFGIGLIGLGLLWTYSPCIYILGRTILTYGRPFYVSKPVQHEHAAKNVTGN